MRAVSPPAAHVAIDDIMSWFETGDAELWEHGLPAAYDVAAAACTALIERKVVVIFESTFTFIPSDGRPPQFHEQQLHRFVGIADERSVPWVVVRLGADLPELLRRQTSTRRLSPTVIEGTWLQHGSTLAVGGAVHDVNTSALTAEDVASRVVDLLADAEQASAPG
jgi:hypothetical protein